MAFNTFCCVFWKDLYEFAIPENLPIGQMGGKVKANDRDVGNNAKSTYNIIEGDEQGVFEIVTDPQTQEGILRLKKVSSSSMCLPPKWVAAGMTKERKKKLF